MEQSELQELSPEELIALSENNTSDFRWDRSEIYKIAFDKCEKSGEKEKLEELRKEILVFDLTTHSYPEKRFDSLMSGTNNEGGEWKYPDMEKHFPKEAIEYYKNRANVTNNPILKARYGDVVWELDKDVRYARLAIRAYLDCSAIYFTNEWEKELSDSLDRAIAIASMINDQRLINESFKKHYELIEQIVERRRFGDLLKIIESILKQERRLKNQIDYEHLISIIESAIVYHSKNDPDSFLLQRYFMELIDRIWQIRKNKDESRKIEVRIAESFIEEAEWKKVNYPSGNMVAASCYEDAMRVYINLGGFSEKVDELKIKIQEANEAARKTEYKRISTKIEIPKVEVDKYLDMYKGHKPVEIFQIMCIDKNLIPSYEHSRKKAIEQSRQFVVRRIFPIALMKGDICIRHITEDDEKLEFSTIQNFQMGYKWATMLLNEIFDYLETEHPKYVESLIQHLSSSRIIDEKRLEIIKHGLRAFENKEYVASIHILVFQIEGTLRDLLRKLGLPTFSYRRNEMRERILPDILATLCQIEGIDKDYLKFIEIYLCDIRGDNYRNDVGHGLLSVDAFSKENAELLLLILIKLASYNILEK